MYTSHNKRTILLSIATICNGNRTEWSPTRSVITRAIDKMSIRLQTEFDEKKSCFQLITGFRLQLTVWLHCPLTTVQNDFCKCTNNIWGIFNGFWLNQILTDTSYLILVRNFSLALQFQDAKRESCFCYTSWNLFRFF